MGRKGEGPGSVVFQESCSSPSLSLPVRVNEALGPMASRATTELMGAAAYPVLEEAK